MQATTSEGIDTGVPDAVYDLILVFQQALEDCHRYQCFAADARRGGDAEVAAFFAELADSDRDIADRARRMLVARLGPA
ncbi:MAG: hypothetical protein R2746_14470 [Acidimicrobiales bacterium]|nr:hypothetical protein [Actinomycetota bacterium]